MGVAASIRSTVRNLIKDMGSDATIYSYSSATKTTNTEGEVTAIVWGGGASVKVISTGHKKYKKLQAMFGIETNTSGREFLARDDITVEKRDKITIDSESYEIVEIGKLDPIENTNCAYKIIVDKNEVYE